MKRRSRMCVLVMALMLLFGAFVPMPVEAAGKVKTVTIASANTKTAKFTKVKTGSYKVTLTEGTKNLGMTVKSGSSKVTSKCSYKSSNTKVLTITKAGKMTAKKAGTAKVTVSYKGKKTTLTVTVKAKKTTAKKTTTKTSAKTPSTITSTKKPATPAACSHTWEKHWVTKTVDETHERTTIFEAVCGCGKTFETREEAQLHMGQIMMKQSLMTGQELMMGPHGSCAQNTCDGETTRTTCHHVINSKYVDYMTCTKCGKKVENTLDVWE